MGKYMDDWILYIQLDHKRNKVVDLGELQIACNFIVDPRFELSPHTDIYAILVLKIRLDMTKMLSILLIWQAKMANIADSNTKNL